MRKLLAVLTGAAVAATCIFGFAACVNDTEENGGQANSEQTQNGNTDSENGDTNPEQSGNTDSESDDSNPEQSGDVPSATAQYNFEEWWQAVTDSLGSDNFASEAEYSYNRQYIVEDETRELQQNYTTFCERQGDVIHIWEENAHVGGMYGETNVKESYVKYSLDEFGVTTELYDLSSLFEYYEDMEDFPAIWEKEIQSYEYEIPVVDGELDDIQWLNRIMSNLQEMSYWKHSFSWPVLEVLGLTRDGDYIDEPDEGTTVEATVETMKQNAEEFYRNKVIYSAQEDSYRIHTDNDTGNGSEDLVFNFLNGKISKLTYVDSFSNLVDSFSDLYDSTVSTVTVNFSYGNANVAVPEEVKIAAEKTEEYRLIAKSLEGNYKIDSAEEDGTYLRLTPGIGFSNASVFGVDAPDVYGDGKIPFAWLVVSEESVVLGFVPVNLKPSTAMLSVDRGALVYTADDGTEYRFIKEEQAA